MRAIEIISISWHHDIATISVDGTEASVYYQYGGKVASRVSVKNLHGFEVEVKNVSIPLTDPEEEGLTTKLTHSIRKVAMDMLMSIYATVDS